MHSATQISSYLKTSLRTFLYSSTSPIIVLLGSTASGKTALSLKIAKKITKDFSEVEIISTDSRQLYKGMKIATDALSIKDRQNIPHHLIAITTPDKPITLAEYKDLALQKIQQIRERKHIPMLVGGTGLYISAIIENYALPRIPPNNALRKKLEKQAAEKGSQFLYEKLKKLDPQAAKKLHPNNLRYVIRALEINLTTGQKKSLKKSPSQKSPFDVFMIGINWPRQELYERINQRVDFQLKKGLVKEVKKLIKKGYNKNLPAMSSLGIKEIIPYCRGKMPLADCVEILKMNTRRYAKRQMTWFRRYANVHWLKPEDL